MIIRTNKLYISFFSEESWQSWSKIGLLSLALLQGGIFPNRIYFLKLVAPKNEAYFRYCVLVAVDLPLQKDEVKCLNVIQEVRGKTVPGYLTLFQRCSSLRYYLVNHTYIFLVINIQL